MPFFGSRGLYCLDMNGKIKWQYFQGRMQTLGSFGEGASPALFEDTLIFPWDHEGDSCLVALNAKNGYVKWKVARQERTNWATPLIVNHNQTKQVIVNGRTVRSYKLETGELLWSCPGQTEQAIPTPLVSQGRVFVTSGLRGWACFAISLDAVGPVPENSEFVHWSLKKQTPYVPSPCNYEGSLFLYNENSRTISVVSEDSGEAVLPPKRLPELGEVYSSLGAANGMVFITDRSGKTLVLDAKSLELLAENTLDETVDASLAFVETGFSPGLQTICFASNPSRGIATSIRITGFFGIFDATGTTRTRSIRSTKNSLRELGICACRRQVWGYNHPHKRGVVAQLVRAPDCRSGGCGFETRRPRFFLSDASLMRRLRISPEVVSGSLRARFL